VLDSVETDHLQYSREVAGAESTSNQTTSEVKAEESKGYEDQESADESRDTTSRTSTRLVKFQLFETKAVLPVVLYV
jgi:hypothetical protein